MITHHATVAVRNDAVLGEGPLWHPVHKMLYWVDIQKKLLHALEHHTNRHRQFEIGKRISTVIPTLQGDLILALEGEIATFDPVTERIETKLNIEDEIADHRCNDGKTDPFGRMWIDTMHVDGTPRHGSLYCIDASLKTTRVLKDLTIPNGMGWSLNHEHMYFIDSEDRNVRCYDVNEHSIELKNERIVISFNNANEVPDGMCVDSEGMLWIGFHGGKRVGRYDPFTGAHLADIRVPALNVTSCCFGGDDLDILYITTATEGLTQEQLKEFPLSGSLFLSRVNVKGLAPFYFDLKQ